LGSAPKQHLDAGHKARGIQPDFGTLGVKPQQRQLGVVLASLVPCRDVTVPQAVNGGAVVINGQSAVQCGKQIMALGGEGRDGAVPSLQLLQ